MGKKTDVVIAQGAVLKLDENKAPGPGGVSAKILKSYAAELTATRYFQQILVWRFTISLAIITRSIFQKLDRATASNLINRLVSLKPICCKVFEPGVKIPF